MIESSCLNCYQRFRQAYALDGTVFKGTAAYIHYISAEIKCCEIDIYICAGVTENSNTAISQLCVFPIAVSHHICDTEIISRDAVIPILCEIRRERLCGKVYAYLVRAEESISAYEIHTCRHCYAFEIRAVIKSISAKESNTIRHSEVFQTLAEAESKIIYICHFRVAEVNRCKLSHPLKAMRLY